MDRSVLPCQIDLYHTAKMITVSYTRVAGLRSRGVRDPHTPRVGHLKTPYTWDAGGAGSRRTGGCWRVPTRVARPLTE